jgi:predicted DNA-binding transcriptional regulator AlpA
MIGPPLWVDMPTLCHLISCSSTTVETWAKQGILPPPRKRGGKLMWKWAEVDAYLTNGRPGGSPDQEADDVRESTRRALEGTRSQARY